MIDTIPNFVLRGLSRRTTPDRYDDISMTYRDEADLRDAIAASWWLAGWDVRTEFKVPNCGRIDVLAEAPGVRVVIEVKQRIKSATEARQAFQQAHAYVSYMDSLEVGRTEQIHGYVTAADLNTGALDAARRAYRHSVINVDMWWLCAHQPQMIAHTSAASRAFVQANLRERREFLELLASAVRSAEVSFVDSIECLSGDAS